MQYDADQTKQKGHGLPDVGGGLGRARVFHAGREQRPQHTSAIHGKGRKHVEAHQPQVRHHQFGQEVAAHPPNVFHFLPTWRASQQGEEEKKRPSNQDVHSRPGQRHPQFLAWVFGHTLQARHAADRQQDDVAGLNAIPPRSEGVSQLVQNDAAKNHQNKEDPGESKAQAVAFRPVGDKNKQDQQQERGVHIHVDSRQLADSPGPAHKVGLLISVLATGETGSSLIAMHLPRIRSVV